MLAVVLVLAVAGVAYALQREDSSAGVVTATARCGLPSLAAPTGLPSPQAVPVRLPAPAQVRLRLLNGSSRDRLARSVGNELARRGFTVTVMGNAPRPLTGASRVYFGPAARAAALVVSAQVLGASIQPVGNAGRGAVDLVLGSSFGRLRSASEAAAYERTVADVTAPAGKPDAPRAVASPTCR
ncbi:MAG: hypothetical protein NVS3B26_03720 [Mycobacteriales bacterium]